MNQLQSGLMKALTSKRMSILCIMADEKEHFAEELANTLNMKPSNFFVNVLQPLITDNFCSYGEPIKTRKRGRAPRPIIIKSFTCVGQSLRDRVIFDTKSLEAATQVGKDDIRETEQHGNVVTISGYFFDRPDEEIRRLENSLQFLREWSKKREPANRNMRNTDGVGQIEETLTYATDTLERVKKKFSVSKQIVRVHPTSVIQIKRNHRCEPCE